MATSVSDGDTSDLSSYISDSSSDELEAGCNASNDVKPNLNYEFIGQGNSGRRRSTDEPMFSFTTMKIDSQMIVESDALTTRISPDKSSFAVGLSNGVIRIFFIDKQANEKNIIALRSPNEKLACNDMTFIDNSSKFISKNSQRLWDCFNQNSYSTPVFEIFEPATPCDFNSVPENEVVPNELLCVALSADGTRFVTGGSDTIIKVYDLTTRTCLLSLKSGVTALVYHPRGKTDGLYNHIFVSASWDQTIQIWDDRKVASLWHYYGPHVVGSDGLDIDGVQNVIVAASWVRSGVMLKMWKFADFSITGKSMTAKRKILQNYSKPVNEVALEGSDTTTQGYVARIGGEGRYIFYAGYGVNIIKVVDRENMSIVAGLSDLPAGVYSLDSCLDPRDKRRCIVVFTNGRNAYLASVQAKATFMDVAST